MRMSSRMVIMSFERTVMSASLPASSEPFSGCTEWAIPRGCWRLLQRLVDLDIALQHFRHKLGQFDAALLGLPREVLPHPSLDGDRHQHLGAGRNVVKAANSFAEVDLVG